MEREIQGNVQSIIYNCIICTTEIIQSNNCLLNILHALHCSKMLIDVLIESSCMLGRTLPRIKFYQ